MQNIALPNADEVRAQINYGAGIARAKGGVTRPAEELIVLRTEMTTLQAFIRALYAKHGEECPLFKEGE